jgi:tetratricopeptide (TPR) repeat protein
VKDHQDTNKFKIFIVLTLIIYGCRSDLENTEIPKINRTLIMSDFNISVIDSLYDIYKPNDYLAGMKLIALYKNGFNQWHTSYFWDTCDAYSRQYGVIGHQFDIIYRKIKELNDFKIKYKDSIFDDEVISDIKKFKGKNYESVYSYYKEKEIELSLKSFIDDYEENRRDINNKEDIWSHILLSEIYKAVEDYEYSNEVLFEALDKESDNPLILDLITQNFILKGELEEANYYFEQIDKQYPKKKYIKLKNDLDSLSAYNREYYGELYNEK